MVSVPHLVYRRRRLIGSGPFWRPNFAAIRAIKSHLNPVNNHFFRSTNNKGDCSSELPMRCVRQRLNTARNSVKKTQKFHGNASISEYSTDSNDGIINSPTAALVRWGGKTKHLLTAYFLCSTVLKIIKNRFRRVNLSRHSEHRLKNLFKFLRYISAYLLWLN